SLRSRDYEATSGSRWCGRGGLVRRPDSAVTNIRRIWQLSEAKLPSLSTQRQSRDGLRVAPLAFSRKQPRAAARLASPQGGRAAAGGWQGGRRRSGWVGLLCSPARWMNFTRACLHSFGTKNYGDGVDHGGEAFIGFFIARRDASKHLDLAEEVFNE